MREDLLHYVWKFRNFNSHVHFSSCGQQIDVIHPGVHNHDSGPDFFNARIRIGELVWAGNVEIHVKSSDWVAHGHCGDRAYDNVILHVVYDDDKPEKLKSATFSTLEIKNQVDPGVLEKYNTLSGYQPFVPCATLLHSGIVDNIITRSYLERLCVERLEYKSKMIMQHLSAYRGNWEHTYYSLVARSIGLGANRLPFELLMSSIPAELVIADVQSLEKVEALLFGQAGFLGSTPPDDYAAKLQAHYGKFQSMFQLRPISKHLWKFSRMRPGNFPALRIAQLAVLFCRGLMPFRFMMQARDLQAMLQWFRVEASQYWAVHSRFGKRTVRRSTRVGNATLQSIVINAALPAMFTYGRLIGQRGFPEQAIELMRQLCGENNKIISTWQDLGFSNDSALESQSLLHLKKEYCDHKKCLSCTIGTTILSQSAR